MLHLQNYMQQENCLYRYKRIRFNSFLWRYYLPTAGIARYYKAAAGGLVTGICKLNEKFSFVVSGSGLKQTIFCI